MSSRRTWDGRPRPTRHEGHGERPPAMNETEHDPHPEPGAGSLVPEDGAGVSTTDQQVASDAAAFKEAIKEGEQVQLRVPATRAQRDGAPVLELRSVSTHYGLVGVLRD